MTFDPEKRITAKEALQHPWITNEQENVPDVTNLVPTVLRGIEGRKSLKSVVTAMTLLSHWKHLEDLSDISDSDTESEKH